MGRSIAFGAGQYAPESRDGRELLAHELTHVVQQSGSVRRKPNDKPAQYLTAIKPKSSAIQNVIAFYKKLGPTDIKQYFIVDKNKLTIYDRDGKLRETFTVKRPGLIDVTGYYLGNPFNVGWGWISQTEKGGFGVAGISEKGMREARATTPSAIGKVLQALDQELFVPEWIKEDDAKKFRESTEPGLIAMTVMNTPLKTYSGDAKEGPVLSYEYPAWFKALKVKVEARISEDRKANKDDPNLPERTYFYGSDKVQAQRGADAWTIEVEKGKREAYLTVLKKEWDDAADKDVYAGQIAEQLYKKVKLIVDETALQKQEQKEITEIDRTGAAKKGGSKFAWAVALKKQIESLLSAQKQKETSAKDFPDKLTLATQGEGTEAFAHLRVWVYTGRRTPSRVPSLS